MQLVLIEFDTLMKARSNSSLRSGRSDGVFRRHQRADFFHAQRAPVAPNDRIAIVNPPAQRNTGQFDVRV
jgi:hypothetical protein